MTRHLPRHSAIRFALAPAALLVAAVLTAGPLAALPPWGGLHNGYQWQTERPPLGFSQGYAARFGVVSIRDSATGERRTEPWASAALWVNWGHQTDNGWRVDLSLGVEGNTLGPLRPGMNLPHR